AGRQSLASTDRKEDGKRGKCPDIMFIEKYARKLYELMFVKSSRLICLEQKKKDDKIKLWREINDGMYYLHRNCRPDRNEFEILGIQVVGEMMHLNILIKDTDDIYQLYHRYSTRIPIQFTNSDNVIQFVNMLLVLRNILIINVSLLLHGPLVRSDRLKKRSSTIFSDSENK
ncbi:1128_t:CDS:1, partial [Diversispora eburnea]